MKNVIKGFLELCGVGGLCAAAYGVSRANILVLVGGFLVLYGVTAGLLFLVFQEKQEKKQWQIRELEQELGLVRRDARQLQEQMEYLPAPPAAQQAVGAEKQQGLLDSLLPDPDEEDGEQVDLLASCSAVIAEMEPFAKQAKIEMQLNAADEAVRIQAHPKRIRILFRNIIDNSIKYMDRAGSLVVTISRLEDDIFIIFKDNGCGLSEMELEHIFELNFQGSNRTSGNGLGLAQSKVIVEHYRGVIYARSGAEGGMGIYIQLPAGEICT